MVSSISKQKKKKKQNKTIHETSRLKKKKSKAVSSVEDTFKLIPVSIADVSVKQRLLAIFIKSHKIPVSQIIISCLRFTFSK